MNGNEGTDGPNGRDGRPVPQHLIAHAWKPGQSGNPGGRPKKKGLVHYLREYFGETVTAVIDGVPTTIKREEHLARMIAEAAMHSDLPSVKMECLKICIDQLWPTDKQPITFIAANPTFHDNRTLNLIGMLEHKAGGGQISPNMVLDLLEADARGELEHQPIVSNEDGNNGKPTNP